MIRTIATMLAPWESSVPLLRNLAFHNAISAAFNVSRKIVLRQLHSLDYGILILYQIDGSKHVFQAPTTTGVMNRGSDGTVRPFEEGQLCKKRAPG